jgi:Na+-driven multidrug efflux pump
MYPVVFGLGATLVAMVGTNVGAGQLARAVRITWIAAGIAVLVTGLIGLAAIVWPQAWISLFTDAPEVGSPAAAYLGIAALGYAFIGMNTLTSAFQAMGQTLWPLMGVLSRAAVLAIGGWLVVSVMGGGVIGLAIVTASGLAIGGGIVAIAFWLGMRRKLGGLQ